MPGCAPTPARLADAPEVRAVLAWIAAHGRDVDEAPFWRSYVAESNPWARLRYLQAYLDHRPGDPMLACPRPGRTMDATAQRAVVVVAYLLGDFAAPDLPAIARPWTWREVAAYATAHGGDGFDQWTDANRGPGRYRATVATGALRIVCQPPDALAVIALVSAPAAVQEIGGVFGATAGCPLSDALPR